MKIRTLIFLGIAAITWGCQKNEKVVNPLEIRHQSPEQVAELIGKPDSAYYRSIMGNRYFIYRYPEASDTEIRFLNNRAVEIIFNEPFEFEFAPETISRFGLEYKPPTSMDTSAMIIWKNHEGFNAITFYKTGENKPEGVKNNFKIYFNMKEGSGKAVEH